MVQVRGPCTHRGIQIEFLVHPSACPGLAVASIWGSRSTDASSISVSVSLLINIKEKKGKDLEKQITKESNHT